MLHLYIGHKQDYFLSGNKVFDNRFDMNYLLEDFSKKVVKLVDKSEVIDKYCIKSPVLGGIAPSLLSGGTKTLLMLRYTDLRFYLEAMGDNCFPFLLEISKVKDIYMCTTRYRYLFKYGFTEIFIENTEEIVTSDRRFLDLSFEFGGENV